MSAFVVDLNTMDRVVAAICSRDRYGQIVRQFLDIDTQVSNAPTLIGRRLYSLNIDAVMQRYPDTEDAPQNIPGEEGCMKMPLSYRFKGRIGRQDSNALIAGYKAIRCLMYQCSEGDADKSSVFAALNEAAFDVAHEIVSRTPEYEKAGW